METSLGCAFSEILAQRESEVQTVIVGDSALTIDPK
jgi:hypothetical protein